MSIAPTDGAGFATPSLFSSLYDKAYEVYDKVCTGYEGVNRHLTDLTNSLTANPAVSSAIRVAVKIAAFSTLLFLSPISIYATVPLLFLTELALNRFQWDKSFYTSTAAYAKGFFDGLVNFPSYFGHNFVMNCIYTLVNGCSFVQSAFTHYQQEQVQ